ncbi:hypothetical protein TNCV_4500251 [Trichonephila clavipes]|nr:hypothetical protein TNCV_4500251 [Trichonephila clavipes]
MNYAAPVPTSSEMKNSMKSMCNYLDAHSDGEMNNKMDDIEQFVDNLMLKKDNAKKNANLFSKNSFCATANNPAIMASVNRAKKDGTKEEPYPKTVDVYNDVMGGVDRFDQRKERVLSRHAQVTSSHVSQDGGAKKQKWDSPSKVDSKEATHATAEIMR